MGLEEIYFFGDDYTLVALIVTLVALGAACMSAGRSHHHSGPECHEDSGIRRL